MDDILIDLEEHIRLTDENHEQFGELCVEGTYYWVIAKRYTPDDVKDAKVCAGELRKLLVPAQQAGGEK